MQHYNQCYRLNISYSQPFDSFEFLYNLYKIPQCSRIFCVSRTFCLQERYETLISFSFCNHTIFNYFGIDFVHLQCHFSILFLPSANIRSIRVHERWMATKKSAMKKSSIIANHITIVNNWLLLSMYCAWMH